VVLIN